LVFPHLPERLVSLRLTSLPCITQLLLMEISRRCANLRELELSVVQRLSTDCCWACFEELSSCIKHSPVGSDALSTTAGDLAVSDPPQSTRRAHAASLDVLCRVPSAPGKPETPFLRSFPVFSCRLEGTHRQPLLGKTGLPANRVHFG
jgi:hypothetical protein